MPRADATLPIQPLSNDFVDLAVSGGTMGPGVWRDARNAFFRDDGTPTRRSGLLSYHEPFDDISSHPRLNSVNGGAGPETYRIGGLYEFVKIGRAKDWPIRSYLAKVDQYLLGSRDGWTFNVPLAQGLGGSEHYIDFSEFFQPTERIRYLIVSSTDPGFEPHFWNGTMGEPVQPNGDEDPDLYWRYFRRIRGSLRGPTGATDAEGNLLVGDVSVLPNGTFTQTHNNRLFVVSTDGNTVYYSRAGEFRDFVNGGFFNLDPRFGECTGFFPTYYGELFIGQEFAVNRVLFTLTGEFEALVPISTEEGPMNNRCIAQVGSELYYLGTKGQVRQLSTTQRFGDVIIGAHSARVYRRFVDIWDGARKAAFMVDDPENQILWIGHSQGSGTANDTLTGWDYIHDKWLYVENEALIEFTAGGTMTFPRFQRPMAVFGTDSVVFGDPDTNTPEAGRVFLFDRKVKEDSYLSDRTEIANDTSPSNGIPIVTVPTIAGINYTVAELNVSPIQQAVGDNYSIRYTVTSITGGATSGIPGTTASIVITGTYTSRDAATGDELVSNGSVSAPMDIGAPYAGTPITLPVPPGLGAEVLTVEFPTDGRSVGLGTEFHVLLPTSSQLVETAYSDLWDLNDNTYFVPDRLVPAQNFVPFLETAGFVLGNPHQEIDLKGITVLTKVVGNHADPLLVVDDGAGIPEPSQWVVDRWKTNVYIRSDKERNWQPLALLDGNSAQKHHLSRSAAEEGQVFVDRERLLALKTSNDGTESVEIIPGPVTVPGQSRRNGTPLAFEEDVNVHYIDIGKNVKTFWLRFGQETAMMGASMVPTFARERGRWMSDMNIVGLHIHFDAASPSPDAMDQGAANKRYDLEGQSFMPGTTTFSDITLTITADNTSPSEGTPVTYTLTLNDNGGVSPTSVWVYIPTPLGMTLGPSSGDGSFSNSFWFILSWSGPTMQRTVQFTPEAGTSGQTITTTATVVELEPPNEPNEPAQASVDVTVA